MSRPSNISGFSAIAILYNSLTAHYLYARTHASGKSDTRQVLPQGRTLFLVNVPPDATERELVLFFKHNGTVEKVLFDFDVKELNNDVSDSEDDQDDSMDEVDEAEQPAQKKRRKQINNKEEVPLLTPLPPHPLRKIRRTGRSAHVIFLDSSSLERALASTSKPRAWPTSSEPSGLSHYKALYCSFRPPLDSVRAFADSYLEVHEYNLAKQKQKSKHRKGEAIVDEDGFTLVTRGGAYGQTLGGGVGVASKRFQRLGQATTRNRGQKKEKKEKAGFYAFQKAEKQRSELMELKRKWEEDKAKVEQLKASRRFKPY